MGISIAGMPSIVQAMIIDCRDTNDFAGTTFMDATNHVDSNTDQSRVRKSNNEPSRDTLQELTEINK